MSRPEILKQIKIARAWLLKTRQETDVPLRRRARIARYVLEDLIKALRAEA